jgi:hypothetical protein
MATNNARHHYTARTVNDLCPAVFLLKGRGLINFNDSTRLNCYGMVLENPAAAIHRNKNPILYEQISQD